MPTITLDKIKPVTKPIQLPSPQPFLGLDDAKRLIMAQEARDEFKVSGAGLTVAVLDTGINRDHVDFTGRIITERNYTADNGGNSDDAADGSGHGTNVAGIIAAKKGDHEGVAPDANIIPIKVLSNDGGGDFDMVVEALSWVVDNHAVHNITAVCMSLGDTGNYQSDAGAEDLDVTKKISELKDLKIAVCIAAGNDFFTHSSQQGMAFPGILRDCISVGAVYDAFEGPFSYSSGAETTMSGPDRITPFSQRLHSSVDSNCRTDIFAPGAPVKSSGINGARGESIQHGTSQAAPITAGVILLMQELYLRSEGQLPEIGQLVSWLQKNARVINDGDDEKDNVDNTGLNFLRVSTVGSLKAVQEHLDGN